MANSGRIEASISENRYTLRVDWTQSPDAATNTSTITAKL